MRHRVRSARAQTFAAVTATATCLFTLTSPSPVLAWGATGHRLIGQLAIEALPPELPAFLRTAAIAQAVGELSREPDRSRGAGAPHDADLDPGHFVDLDDDGKVSGGPGLADLPQTRAQYDAALRAVGNDSYRSGYLPYNIEDGFEQLTKDFAYWRVETAALKTTTERADRAWIVRDLALRQQLIIRDLGYWAHFVGDGSQPMHVTIHYNGWGAFPNPSGFTRDHIHGPFEGQFVHDFVTAATVRADLKPYRACTLGVAACTSRYLLATGAWVQPLYALWGQGGFNNGDARGRAFAAARVADGAAELRDLVVDAWRASATDSVGHPALSVKVVEAGQPVPMAILYGDD